METVIRMFGRGQVTLPKKMRDRYKTKHFIARATNRGILIEPLYTGMDREEDDEVELIETDKEVRLHFKNGGMPAAKALALLKQAHAQIRKVPR